MELRSAARCPALTATDSPYSSPWTAAGSAHRETGKVYSRHTTKDKAERQRRLLEGVRHGWKPTGKKPDDD